DEGGRGAEPRGDREIALHPGVDPAQIRESLRQGPNRRPGIVGPIPRRSRWDTLAHGEGAGREARLAVDEARRAVGTRLKRDAKALAESHREHGQAAVIDVLTDQVHAA